MKITGFLLGSCALLVLPFNAAGAGQCTSEINALSKMMAAHDAGSGPTPGAAASNMGQHPPTAAMNEADQGTAASAAASQSGRPQHPPTAVMNRETTGMSSPSGSAEPKKDEHPPTAVMNRETQGSAASSQDVQRQNQGQPTASQQMHSQIAQTHSMGNAMAALQRARFFDQQGKEAECLSALGQARLMLGPQ